MLLRQSALLSATWKAAQRRVFSQTACRLDAITPPETPKSSVAGGTVLKGINYMRDASDPVAKEDSAYPDWVWTLLTPRSETSDGGIGDKKTLRRKNRENIRDSNFMKSRKT